MKSSLFLTLILGFSGGSIAALVDAPIPWLLGSLLATAIFGASPLATGSCALVPPGAGIERFMRVAIGVTLGPSIAAHLLDWNQGIIVAAVAACLCVIILSLLGSWLFRCYLQMSRVEAFLSSLPGGLSFMMALAGDSGKNRARIALIHTVRVVSLVTFVSVIAYFVNADSLGSRWLDSFAVQWRWQLGGLAFFVVVLFLVCERIPVAGVHVTLPTCVASLLYAAGVFDLPMPELIRTVAMLIIGIVLGCELGKGPRHEYFKLAKGSLLFTSMAFLLAAVLAIMLSRVSGSSFLVLFLAFAPGGIVEVSLIGLALQLDVGLIALAHLSRFLFIMLVGPLGLAAIKRRNKAVGTDGKTR